MYQIFVVEDELLIRQNIRHMLENMEGPYAFCGEASDGEMALSIIQEIMPDILLTDIRMPFLDGLSLIKHAKVMMPWLKVGVISGYDDFEYAQKAISLGVNKYLLKPVKQADLTQAVRDMAAQLDKERTVQFNPPGVMNKEDIKTALIHQWLEQLLYEKPALSDMLERAEVLKLDVVKSHYLVTLLSFDSSDVDLYLLKRKVQKIMNEADCRLYLFNTADQMTLITCDNDAYALNERVYQLISILRHELHDICPVITAAISRETFRLGDVGDAYHAVAQMMRALRNICAGKVLNMNDDAISLETEIMQIDGPFGKSFQEKLLYALPEEIPDMVDSALASFPTNQFESILIRYQSLVSVAKTTARMVVGVSSAEKYQATIEKIQKQFDLIAAAGNKNRFHDTITKMLQIGAREHEKRMDESQSYRHVISCAEKYARENFCDPNISLMSTAKHVGMSSAYFSTVFSQTTGQSFIRFLTSLRIERAKELLTNTKRRISDIAMDIGYNEPNYFSHVFRKTTGVTPKEYRQRNSD